MALVVIDTSIWVEFFRGRDAPLVSRLVELIDHDHVLLTAPVRIELLMGAARSEVPALRRVLSALPLLVPSEQTWFLLEAWTDTARRAGERFGTLDLLIAAIAFEHDALLWSKDKDFTRMARLKFARLFQTTH